MKIHWLFFLLLFLGKSAYALKNINYEFSLITDARLALTEKTKNWQNGGDGISTYGGSEESNRAQKIAIGRSSFIVDFATNNKALLHAQFNFDNFANNDADLNAGFGIVKLVLTPHKSKTSEVRLGLLFPPISFEHERKAWNPIYMISSSSMNSWVGEELRHLGIDLIKNIPLADSNLNFTATIFSYNDPATAILAWRGWAIHDYQLKFGDKLQLQNIDPRLSPLGVTKPNKELDGRPGVMALAAWSNKSTDLNVFYYNNLSRGLDFDGEDYSWHADFIGGSAKKVFTNKLGKLTLLSQGLSGVGYMGPQKGILGSRVNYFSWFLLANLQMAKNSFSARIEKFKVIDRDAWPDNDSQDGQALAISYGYSFDAQQSLMAEYLMPQAERQGRGNVAAIDAQDNLLQILYRLKL